MKIIVNKNRIILLFRSFSSAYATGEIPCRIVHGNIKLTLKWDRDPQTLSYNPLLLTCFEGLLETEHPFNFTSRQIIKTLLSEEINGAVEKVNPLLSKLVVSMRNALNSKIEFLDNLTILSLLSELVKTDLNKYLHLLLQPLNKGMMKFKEPVMNCLRVLETNGGDEAYKIIKKKIPVFVGKI